MLVSGIQQSDSVTQVSVVFQILFPFKLLQNAEERGKFLIQSWSGFFLAFTDLPHWQYILILGTA